MAYLYNEKWHDHQAQALEKYSNVIANNHEIKITTSLNNIYFYVRAMSEDEVPVPLPYTWTVTKNSFPEMVLSDPEDPESPLVQKTVEINQIDTLLRWFYQQKELPREVIIN